MYSTSGSFLGSFSTSGLAPSPFDVLAHQGGILVCSSSGSDDIHRFTLTGTSVGTFHNRANLNFVEQLAVGAGGSILAAGFSSNNVATLDPDTGAIINSFTASGVRGVYQLGNGNIRWSDASGTFVYDVTTNTSTQVYTGSGRFLEFAAVPEPSTIFAFGAGVLLLALRLKVARR